MGKKKKPKHYWNFRIITEIFKYPENMIDPSIGKHVRTFSIVEVHYENGHPISYGGRHGLNSLETVEDLKWMHKKMKKAFKKPILDADNCLQIFVSEKLLTDE